MRNSKLAGVLRQSGFGIAGAMAAAFLLQAGAAVDPAYAPLWLYNGAWQVSENSPPGGKLNTLLNRCALVGKYFACEQTVNGKPQELLIFIPAKEAGHYYTQSILPEGRAGGLGGLEISGDKWIYSSTWNQGGSTIFYKTINVFTGKNRIHFEQQESSNNKDWKTTNFGDETRSAGGTKPVR